MGLIYNILKTSKTQKLPAPLLVLNLALIESRSDREYLATIRRLEEKKTLTAADKRDFRGAVSVLKRRGALKTVTEIEIG